MKLVRRLMILAAVLIIPLLQTMEPSNLSASVKDHTYYIPKYLVIFPNLEPADVLTVIDVESGFKPHLVTPEPKVKDESRGPMQVRVRTARHAMKFRGPIEDLCTWEYGLYYGMKYLSWKKEEAWKKAKNPVTRRKHMWAGYNGGNCTMIYKDKQWKYDNQGYVNKCESIYQKYKSSNSETSCYRVKDSVYVHTGCRKCPKED